MSLIKSIAFKNFYNFYGDYSQNNYIFGNGLNIIVADNGCGKSKFFNGFLWILKNKVLDSDDHTEYDVNFNPLKIISDKAKAEININEKLECGVIVTFEAFDKMYEVNKFIIAKKKDNNGKWDFNFKDKYTKKDVYSYNTMRINDVEEKDKIVNRIIRPEFRKYALLQGEEVDKIIDFNNENSLIEAIRVISDINKIEELCELSEYMYDRAEKDFNEQMKKYIKDDNKYDQLLKDKDNFKSELKKEEEILKNHQHNYSKSISEKDELLGKISSANQRQGFRNQITDLDNQIKKLILEIDMKYENLNKLFFSENIPWVLLGMDGVFNEFYNARDNYIREKAKLEMLKKAENNPNQFFTLLPSGSPDLHSLEEMINECKCFVCGREAPSESEAWNHIVNVYNSHKKGSSSSDSYFKNNLSNFYSKLQIETQKFSIISNDIINSVVKEREKIKSLNQRVGELKKKKDLLYQKYFEYDGTREGIETEEEKDINIIDKFGKIEERIGEYINKINNTKNIITDYNSKIQKNESEISKYESRDLPKGYENSKNILGDLNKIIGETKERIFNEKINELAFNSNKHFKDLIKNSELDGGIIHFQRTSNNTINTEIKDINNNLVIGLSTGFQRMKKIAVLMAIISSNSSKKFQYPLIADAPLSVFAIGFIKSFFSEIPKVFDQSIVLIKELYDNNTENNLTDVGCELLENKSVSNFYINYVEKNKQQIDRVTIIKKLK